VSTKKGIIMKSIKKIIAISILAIMACLYFSANSYAANPVYYDGWSDQFRVTVTWEVLNDHQDEGNGFGVYYYKPANGCYYKADTGQYSFFRNITKAAKEKGTKSCTFDLQGPPCKIYMQVYGSAMDHTQFYLKKVEVEPIHPRPGTGLPTKFTLWEGKFGCSVATMFTNTIACDLFLDRGKPEFSNWYDPYTHREAVFGDDKVNSTDKYYDKGCQSPYIYCKDSDGNYCDQYGVAWPSYYPGFSAKPGRKVVINWRNYRKHIKAVFPKAKFLEVQYSTNARFKKAKKKKIKIKNLRGKTVIRHLKAKKTYYFRLRLSNGKKTITAWCYKHKVKTKK
jgi:hypothetical protein